MTRTDSIDCARRLFALAALALAVDAGHALEINADASFFDGNQYLDTAVTTTAQTTTAVSQADATNFAVARVDATTGAVGIGFGSTGTSGHFGANTVGVLNETWTCPVNVL